MSLDNPAQQENDPLLGVSSYPGNGKMCLTFYCEDITFSHVVSKDQAREFAENILKLIKETAVDCLQHSPQE